MAPNNQYELSAKGFSVMADFGGVALFSVLLHFHMEYNSELILPLIYLLRGSKLSIVIHVFFISNIFISNARLKLVKIQANTKQHPESELVVSEKYSHSSSTLSSRNNMTCS